MSWICPKCETENPDTMEVCEVCLYYRDKNFHTLLDEENPQANWYNKVISFEKETPDYVYILSKYRDSMYKTIRKYAPYLLISADKGNPDSQFKLGVLFISHWNLEYREKAFVWFARSANQGNGEAMEKLAFCYEYGIGTGKDINEAKKWYERAFNKGCEIAKQGLKRIKTLY